MLKRCRNWICTILIYSIGFMMTANIAYGSEPTNNLKVRMIDTRAIAFAKPFYQAVVNGMVGINNMHPQSTELKTIGTSVDGNPIMAIKIGKGAERVLVLGGAHGREALTSVLILNQIEDLVFAYEGDEEIQTGTSVEPNVGTEIFRRYRDLGYSPQKVLDDVSIWFVPLLNPDGAELAMNGTVHIKNKSKLSVIKKDQKLSAWKANLNGVDLNRNYDLAAPRSGQSPGYSEYAGPYPYSEPETQAIMNFTRTENFSGVLNYHSRGEIVYYEEDFYSMASKLLSVTGYSPYGRNEKSTVPTYDRWYYNEFKRPVFTIEVGNGATGGPVPYEQYGNIWNQNWRLPIILARELQKMQMAEVFYDGVKVNFVKEPIRTFTGQVMVPVRNILETLGAFVSWNAETKTVSAVAKEKTIVLDTQAKIMMKDGEGVSQPVEILIRGGCTYAPLRPIAESMGVNVEWDNYTQTAYMHKM